MRSCYFGAYYCLGKPHFRLRKVYLKMLCVRVNKMHSGCVFFFFFPSICQHYLVLWKFENLRGNAHIFSVQMVWCINGIFMLSEVLWRYLHVLSMDKKKTLAELIIMACRCIILVSQCPVTVFVISIRICMFNSEIWYKVLKSFCLCGGFQTEMHMWSENGPIISGEVTAIYFLRAELLREN